MLYGAGIPILLLIAAVSFGILYSMERLLVAYFYQQPPAFDDKLTKNAVSILKWASIMYLFFGYWMLSNYGIFENEALPLKFTNSRPTTDHKVSEMPLNQALPMFLMACVLFVIAFMQTFIGKALKYWHFTFGARKISVDENLPKFWKAIKFTDAEWLIEENNYLNGNYHFQIVDNKVVQELDNCSIVKRCSGNERTFPSAH